MNNRLFKKTVVITALVALLLVLSVSLAAASGGGSANYYTVRYGDTLFSIGRMYGVNPYYIAEVNGLPNPNCIYAGQALYIPGGYQDGGCYYGCNEPVYDGGHHGHHDDGYYGNRHVVSRGETLTSIAYYYGVSPWALANANGIYNLNRIYVGQVLRIPSWDQGYYY